MRNEQSDRASTAEPLVCTVLPTYNERENIRALIEGVLESAVTDHMVLVVDDDSPDGTWQVVESVAAAVNQDERAKVVLIRRRDESGLTSAIQRGIDEAIGTYGADIVTWMDCDLSMPPQDIPKLIDAIRFRGADIAVGSRWIDGGADVAHGPMARTLSYIINGFASLLVSNQVRDYTSGFIAAQAPVLGAIRLQGDYGEYCIDLLGRALQSGFRVLEVPYICVPRHSGDSKTGANLLDYLSKGRHYVSTVWRLYRSPNLPGSTSN
jgi:dolichol-phosphate mannosyltransferase